MEIIKAGREDLKTICDIVHKSIEITYGKFYPQEAVDFFLMIHSEKNIERDLDAYDMWLLREDGNFAGTGCLKGNHITRLYFLPDYQGRGLGTAMMNFLEAKAAESFDTVQLDPSLPAMKFYRDRGYRVISHEDCPLENGVILPHDVMEKKIR